jgi:hypothetical protein
MADCECSVCYEGFTTAEGTKTSVVTLSCGHPFHFACITKWFSGKAVASCPMCRKGMEGVDTFDGYGLGISPGSLASTAIYDAEHNYRLNRWNEAERARTAAAAALIDVGPGPVNEAASNPAAWAGLKIKHFKAWLKSKGLPISGHKRLLEQRVREAMAAAAVQAA